jgi:hypothetical protein
MSVHSARIKVHIGKRALMTTTIRSEPDDTQVDCRVAAGKTGARTSFLLLLYAIHAVATTGEQERAIEELILKYGGQVPAETDWLSGDAKPESTDEASDIPF